MQQAALRMLRCPEKHSPLALVSDDVVKHLNNAIRAGWLTNRGGRRVDELIDGGLMRAEGDLLYPIIADIPVLLHDEAIPTSQLGLNDTR